MTEETSYELPTMVEEHFVQSSKNPWLKLYVRERRPAGSNPGEIKKAVLLVHGTFHPGSNFDSSATRYSWLDYHARRGYAAYYLDLRGYGKSSRPPLDLSDPKQNQPFCKAEEAVEDIAEVVDFIRKRTAAQRVDLIGYSWGSVTVPLYAIENPDRVSKVILVAPLADGGEMAHTEEEPVAPDPGARIFGRGFSALGDPNNPKQINPAIGAYTRWSITDTRRHTRASMRRIDPSLWEVPEIGAASIKDLRAATGAEGDLVSSPSGAQVNLFEFYILGRRFYDPAQLKHPVLLIRGECDYANSLEGATRLFESLGTGTKMLVHVANAGHGLFAQKCAPYVFGVIGSFLEADG